MCEEISVSICARVSVCVRVSVGLVLTWMAAMALPPVASIGSSSNTDCLAEDGGKEHLSWWRGGMHTSTRGKTHMH